MSTQSQLWANLRSNASRRWIARVGALARLLVAASLVSAVACSSSSAGTSDPCCNVPITQDTTNSNYMGGCGCPASGPADAAEQASCVVDHGAGNTCTIVCTVTEGTATVTSTSNAGSPVPYCPGS